MRIARGLFYRVRNAENDAPPAHRPAPRGRSTLSSPLIAIPGFTSMPNGQQHHFLLIDAVQDHIRAFAKRDHPLPELRREFLNESPELWLPRKDPHASPDRLNGASGCIRIGG